MKLDKLAARFVATARSARMALRPRQPRRVEAPQLADGVELIGEYEDSGFKDPPYLVRRPDGQVVQLSRLLYLLSEEADGVRDLHELAVAVSRRFGRIVSAEDVTFLVDAKLRPAGLIRSPHGTKAAAVRRVDPLLALRYRAAVVPTRFVRAGARILRPLFTPVIVGAALSWLVALDVWLAQHGLGIAMRELFAHPVLLLALLALVIVSAVWHEFGHATGCAYGGATPGAMGVGLYVIWPAFYTDVTDAYRLRRGGRLRTDLGGVYFNALFALAAGGAYFATRFEPLLVVVAVQHFQIIQQLTPLMRLDGYYVITDLVGIPDILSRVRPLLLSFLPFRAPGREVAELKPWVRSAATAYIVAFVTALGALLVLLGVTAPHFVPTAVHSAELYSHRATTAWHRHALVSAALAEIQVLTVMLPALGLALGAVRLMRKAAHSATTRVDRRLRLGLGVALAAGIAFGWPFLVQRSDVPTRDAQAAARHHRVHKRPSSAHRRSSHDHRLTTASAQSTTSFANATSRTRIAAPPTSRAPSPRTATTSGPHASTTPSYRSPAAASSPPATITSSGQTPATPPTGTVATTASGAPPASSTAGSGSASPSPTGASSATGTSTTPTQTGTTTSSTDTATTSTSTTPSTTTNP